jgi:hypothetical protein
MRMSAARLRRVAPFFQRRPVSPSNDLSERHFSSQKEKIDAFVVWSSQEAPCSFGRCGKAERRPKDMEKKIGLSRMVA